MTDYQKSKIHELRFKGLGYKAIGNVLGLSRDAVRAYCKSNGMDGDGVTLSRNYEIKKENGILCLNCGKLLKQNKRGKARKFCSEECRHTWWKENADKGNRKETAIYKSTCKYCGVEFESYGNKNRKYCCHEWEQQNLKTGDLFLKAVKQVLTLPLNLPKGTRCLLRYGK